MKILNNDIVRSINRHLFNHGSLGIPETSYHVDDNGGAKPCINTYYDGSGKSGKSLDVKEQRKFVIEYMMQSEGSRTAISDQIDNTREQIKSIMEDTIELYRFDGANVYHVDRISAKFESDRNDTRNEKCIIVVNIEY